MSNEIADLFAKRFIQRKDVKAVQYGDGIWAPHTKGRNKDSERIPWQRKDLNAHLSGTATYGHYLLDHEDRCKLFAFDIDLAEPSERLGDKYYYPSDFFAEVSDETPIEFNPRLSWRDRSHPSRAWTKYTLRRMAHDLASLITEVLEIPVAVAYSGNKGLHVYGFTGPILATDARDGAEIVLEAMGGFTEVRGHRIHQHYPHLTVEVFPKQTSLQGKDLGNLMRLPLGKNLKNPKDPTFFVDMTTPVTELLPVSPEFALTSTTPWKKMTE